jgi:hypothetical protein
MSEAGFRHYLEQAREEWMRQAAAGYADGLAELSRISCEAWKAWRWLWADPDPRGHAYRYLEILAQCSKARHELLGLDRRVEVDVDGVHRGPGLEGAAGRRAAAEGP